MDPTAAITPDRLSRLVIGGTRSELVEKPFSIHRNGSDIHPVSIASLLQLARGAWTVRPVQMDTSQMVEQANPPGLLRAPDLRLSPQMAEKSTWGAPTDILGAMDGAAPGIATSGGYVIRRELPDGTSANDTTFASDMAAHPTPVPATTSIQLSRMLIGANTLPAGTGMICRWFVDSSRMNSRQLSHVFLFGGPFLPHGGGEMAVGFSSDGIATLYIYLPGESGLQWYQINQWRYDAPGQDGGYHSVTILPHSLSYGGPGIDFLAGPGENSDPVGSPAAQFHERPSQTRSHSITLRQIAKTLESLPLSKALTDQIQSDLLASETATGAGVVRLDVARDHLIQVQLSTLTYPASPSPHYPPGATLIDLPIPPIPFASADNPLKLEWEATVPPGTAISGVLWDAKTKLPLTMIDSGASFATFTPPLRSSGYYAVFDFQDSPDGLQAPILESYRVIRDGQFQSVAITEVFAEVKRVNITGPAFGQPATDQMTCEFQDPSDTLAQPFRVNSEIPVRLETDTGETNPDGTPIEGATSWLFAGRTDEIEANKVGIDSGLPFPSPSWRDYEISAVGEWAKLATAQLPERQLLMLNGQPMKVTDIIQAAFGWAGYDVENEVDVPDAPIQFWIPPGEDLSGLILNPATPIADFILKSVRDYLGWNIVRDINAGKNGRLSVGMWRVLKPPQPDGDTGLYTPLASFVDLPPLETDDEGNPIEMAASHPSAYATLGTGTTGLPLGSFIPNRGWFSKVEKPAGNHVTVIGTAPIGNQIHQVRQHMINFNSYAVPGFPTPSPVDNPDYLGYLKPITIRDAALYGQQAVDFMARRTFDVACHARKRGKIVNCPNLLIWDPNDPLQVRPRPLRTYDPVSVTVDGITSTYLVTTYDLTYITDTMQWGTLNLMAPLAGGVQLSGFSTIDYL